MNDVKVPVIRRKDYTGYLEQFDGRTFCHIDIRRWSKSVKLDLMIDFETFMVINGGPVYALHDPSDRKHLKFISMLGFQFAQPVHCKDGITRHLYVRGAKSN